MSRNDRRTSSDSSTIVGAIEDMLNNFDQVLLDTRRIKPAIQHVVDQIEDRKQREAYVSRLLLALTTLAGKNFWGTYEAQKPETHFEKASYNLGNWVLKTFLPSDRIDPVLQELRDAL